MFLVISKCNIKLVHLCFVFEKKNTSKMNRVLKCGFYYKFELDPETAKLFIEKYPLNEQQKCICDRLRVPYLLWSFYIFKKKSIRYIWQRVKYTNRYGYFYIKDCNLVQKTTFYDDMKLTYDEKFFYISSSRYRWIPTKFFLFLSSDHHFTKFVFQANLYGMESMVYQFIVHVFTQKDISKTPGGANSDARARLRRYESPILRGVLSSERSFLRNRHVDLFERVCGLVSKRRAHTRKVQGRVSYQNYSFSFLQVKKTLLCMHGVYEKFFGEH